MNDLLTFEVPRLQKIALTADQSSGEKTPNIIGLTYSSCLEGQLRRKKYELRPIPELPFVKFASFTMVG